MQERKKIVEELLTRRVEGGGVYPSMERAREELLDAKPLSIYWGIDPTAPEVHLGHTVPLLFLKQLKALGHNPIIVIGDFTARIGDPTEKTAARRTLTKEEVETNMEHYLAQITKILPREAFEVRYNSEWLAPMTLTEVLGLASSATVQQMLARDMFQRRIKEEKPIFIHELLYPLMQGYDSVKMGVDGEVGGSDQTFNMLVGRTLVKQFSGKEKLVFALRLLVGGADGKKMSKSEGNIIGLNDSPQEIRRKVLALDDSLTREIFTLCTEKDLDWIAEHTKGDPRASKESLAEELIRMYHGEPAVALGREAVVVEGRAGTGLAELLAVEGVTSSRSEGKRLIEQGGVNVNGALITNWKYEVRAGDRLQVGKGKFIVIES